MKRNLLFLPKKLLLRCLFESNKLSAVASPWKEKLKLTSKTKVNFSFSFVLWRLNVHLEKTFPLWVNSATKQIRNHLTAPSVTKHSQRRVVWRLMKESMMGRNHLAAPSVTKHSQWRVIWRDMKESTLMRSHSDAQSATRHLRRQVIWRPMKESTLMRGHSHAQSVTRHSVVWIV